MTSVPMCGGWNDNLDSVSLVAIDFDEILTSAVNCSSTETFGMSVTLRRGNASNNWVDSPLSVTNGGLIVIYVTDVLSFVHVLGVNFSGPLMD